MCGRLNLLQNVNLFGSGVTAGVISKSKVILEWSGSLTQYNWGNLDIDRHTRKIPCWLSQAKELPEARRETQNRSFPYLKKSTVPSTP